MDGRDITFMKEYRRAALIGRLFQDPMRGTAPDMTVEENLALAYSRGKRKNLSFGVKKSDTAFFKSALLSFGMGLEDRLQSRVGLLSGGQRQVITLLMATIASPKLLMLDEHTAALDPSVARKVLDTTRDIVKDQKLTTLMITHNIDSALKLGSRTVMMNAGRIILDISGKERAEMTIPRLLEMYSQKGQSALDNDRMLLSETE